MRVCVQVQQPLDPTSYYGQFYRPGADSDGHISPFHSPAVTTKYNNGTVLSPQASQSSQEVCISQALLIFYCLSEKIKTFLQLSSLIISMC